MLEETELWLSHSGKCSFLLHATLDSQAKMFFGRFWVRRKQRDDLTRHGWKMELRYESSVYFTLQYTTQRSPCHVQRSITAIVSAESAENLSFGGHNHGSRILLIQSKDISFWTMNSEDFAQKKAELKVFEACAFFRIWDVLAHDQTTGASDDCLVKKKNIPRRAGDRLDHGSFAAILLGADCTSPRLLMTVHRKPETCQVILEASPAFLLKQFSLRQSRVEALISCFGHISQHFFTFPGRLFWKLPPKICTSTVFSDILNLHRALSFEQIL